MNYFLKVKKTASMIVIIRKISSYALLGIIISAKAIAPAQATSLKNVIPDDESLVKTLYNQASADNHNNFNLEKTHDSNNKADYCISNPELYLCNEFQNDDDKKSLNTLLLRKAKSSINAINANKDIKVKRQKNKVYYIYNIQSNASKIAFSRKKQLLYSNIYIREQLEYKIKKKVPEPSAILGLIAFCLLAAKNQSVKKNS